MNSYNYFPWWLLVYDWMLLIHDWLNLSLSLLLRSTVSRPVCLGIKHRSSAYDQIFVTIRQLQVCWCGAFSLTRRRVCRLQLLLALARAVIFGSESRGTSDHVSLSRIRDFRFFAPSHELVCTSSPRFGSTHTVIGMTDFALHGRLYSVSVSIVDSSHPRRLFIEHIALIDWY
jgi:hypothetical protein